MLTREDIAHLSTPLQKTWVPIMPVVPVFKMWSIAGREESLFLLQENVIGQKQPFQRLPCQVPCSSEGHPPSPSLFHKAAELCSLMLGVCRLSEWSGFEENNSLPHTFWRKQIQNCPNQKKSQENGEKSSLVLMLLAYYRKLLKVYT